MISLSVSVGIAHKLIVVHPENSVTQISVFVGRCRNPLAWFSLDVGPWPDSLDDLLLNQFVTPALSFP
jgi:hypothetical protein